MKIARRSMVAAGMKPVDALRAATSGNARILALAGEAGRVAPHPGDVLVAPRGVDDDDDLEIAQRLGADAGQCLVEKSLAVALNR